MEHAAPLFVARKLERLEAPLVASLVPASAGDIIRLAQPDGAWFYCRVEDQTPEGDLVCSVVETQDWPSLMMDGIVPGVNYVVPSDRVLSIVRLRD
jgi:hypothetical protein